MQELLPNLFRLGSLKLPSGFTAVSVEHHHNFRPLSPAFLQPPPTGPLDITGKTGRLFRQTSPGPRLDFRRTSL
jgi:hypothetical protein